MDTELARVAALAAVSTWGITAAIKPSIKRWAADSWVRSGIRLGALFVGAGIGFGISLTAVGCAAGAGGAALSSIIVDAIKSRVKR